MVECLTGSKIKEVRLDKGYTQSKIEKDLGWGKGTLSHYENEDYDIPETRKEQLCKYLGIMNLKPQPQKPETVMGEAIQKAMTGKFTDHLPGEIWVHRRGNGTNLNKLILNIEGNYAYCITIFPNSSRNTDFKLKDGNGQTKFAGTDRLEAIRLKELEKRVGIICNRSMEALKLHMGAILGIAVVTKEVKIPVEKIVEKEVIKEVEIPVEIPVEKIVEKEMDDTELRILRREVEIYKDMIDRLLPVG